MEIGSPPICYILFLSYISSDNSVPHHRLLSPKHPFLIEHCSLSLSLSFSARRRAHLPVPSISRSSVIKCIIIIPMEEMNCMTSATKRQRDETGEAEAKRLCVDLLLDIIDDGLTSDDGLEEEDAAGDLADVMRSLEEEINLSSSNRDAASAVEVEERDVDLFTDLVSEGNFSRGSDDGTRQTELCYLLEASDDELGLPPTITVDVASTSDEGERAEDEFSGSQNWEFREGIANDYATFDLVFDEDEAKTADVVGSETEQGDVVSFDDDQCDLLLSACEFSEFSWMPVE